jgi:hypothetical protein
VGATTVSRDKDTGDDDLPKLTDPGFWTARGCIMTGGAFLSIQEIAAAIYYAIEDYTNGLLLVIAILLAAILFVVATKG